jgi:RNA polymerase sigma-70 factor (ECF subfamily)
VSLLHRLRSDESLLLCYGRGDAPAFAQLYERYKHPLFNFILRSGCPRAGAEDVSQDTWAAVIKSAAAYQPRAAFKTWLYTIARRKVIDQHRKLPPCEENFEDEADYAVDKTAASNNPVSHLETSRLLGFVADLPEDQRTALLLKEEGFSLAEIAAVTESGTETVKSRIRYARSSLRGSMGVGT